MKVWIVDCYDRTNKDTLEVFKTKARAEEFISKRCKELLMNREEYLEIRKTTSGFITEVVWINEDEEEDLFTTGSTEAYFVLMLKEVH